MVNCLFQRLFGRGLSSKVLDNQERIKAASWIKVQAVANRSLTQALRQELDAGEAEAIVLALEAEAELLLMDERVGRETAQHLGIC